MERHCTVESWAEQSTGMVRCAADREYGRHIGDIIHLILAEKEKITNLFFSTHLISHP